MIALAGLIAAGGEAAAEHLTVALSTPEVRISSNFTGAPITVFGVIERDAQTISRSGSYDVAVQVSGPPESVVIRRKDRTLGVWINRASEILLAAPSYYSLATTTEVADLASETLLKRFRIGFNNLDFTYRGRVTRDDPDVADFRDAFLRIKSDEGLYTENVGGVTFLGENVFRSTVWVPANAPVGFYQVSVFLFHEGALLARTDESFTIAKTGFEQYMFNFSREQSFIYGIACVALALGTGWLAGLIFRRD